MKALPIVFCIVAVSHSKVMTLNTCNSSSIFNPDNLQCTACPTNMIPNPNQNIPTSCICTEGYYPDLDHVCTPLGGSPTICATNEYMPAFSRTGAQSSNLNTISCTTCDQTSHKNSNGTGCTPCPINMIYDVGQADCVCSDSAFVKTQQGCFDETWTSGLGNLGESSSVYSTQLKYLFPACYHFKDLLSCSYLVNLCTYSLLDASTAECKYFTADPSSTNYLYYNNNNPYHMPAGTFNQQSTLNFKLIKFLPTGNYVGEKEMKLPDLLRCGMPSNNSARLNIGNNIKFECQFDFDYLLDEARAHTYKEYVYELFLEGAEQEFYQVEIFIDGNQQACRRFFLQDTFTSDTSVNVVTSMDFKIYMNTSGHLITPRLDLSYTELSVSGNSITPDSDRSQTISYSVSFVYDLKNFWTPFTALIIVVHVIIFIQSVARTYIGYLNRQSFFSFFFYFLKFWSLWMFYFLFCISGYWFLFSKTTQELYILIPDANDPFYTTFYVLAALMGFFRIVTVIIEKKSKLATEVFMINWEKAQFKNSWRQIFIINSLAQFYTHRTISLFWMLMVVMFFLTGLNWDSHAAEVTHTSLDNIYYFNPINRVLLYFLGAAIFIIVGIVFKILRRLSVIKWSYPFEDFVDYCNVTNISFFFMKKRSAQAHYIHASIADRTEVTFKEINEAIRRGLNKNRNIANQHSFHEHQRMYTVYVCKQLQDRFHNMLKRLEDEEHEKIKSSGSGSGSGKGKNKNKKLVDPREQFIEKKLKPHLDAISREGSNRNKTISESLLGMPPVDLRDPSSLQNRNYVIFDDNQDLVSDVFPNGNQFEQIHTMIILFLIFILMTASITISAFLTYFVDQFLINGWISNSCREKLEKMTKVKQGFML